MDEEKQVTKPMLIYFKARGYAQVVRCVLYEIGVDFEQLFVGYNGNIDANMIKKYKIDLKNLPYYIDGDLIIFGIFPIIKYLCVKYNRVDLLGKTLEDQIKIAQFMVKEMRQKGIILNTLFKGIKEIKDKNLGEQGIYNLTIKIIQNIQNMKSIDKVKQMIFQMLDRKSQFVNGYLTIMDFAIFQRTFYVYHLKYSDFPMTQVPKKYYQFFIKTDFYAKHGQKLSSYKVFFPQLDCQLNKLVGKMWKQDLCCKGTTC